MLLVNNAKKSKINNFFQIGTKLNISSAQFYFFQGSFKNICSYLSICVYTHTTFCVLRILAREHVEEVNALREIAPNTSAQKFILYFIEC